MADRPDTPGQILLHIGTQKTGTTSIQYFLRHEREGLVEAADAEYPRGLVLPASHSELPLLTVRPERAWPARLRFPEVQQRAWLDAARAHVKAQVAAASHRTLVYSHEDLSYLRFDDEFERLRDLLGSRPVRVVVYLRDRIDYLRSYGAQLIATGFPESDDPTSFAYLRPDSWLTDYDALVDGYRRCFGAESVEVVDYDSVLLTDGSVLPSFADLLAIPRSALPASDASFLNRSGMYLRPTEEQLAAIRRRLAAQAQ